MVSLEAKKSKRFQLHSISVEILGNGADRLARDFDFFSDRPKLMESEEKFSITLELITAEPDLKDLPERKADQIFPDCVLYREENSLIYDYFGLANLTVNRHSNYSHGILTCNDSSLTEELGYLFLQSEIGRFLDQQGLHRVHALGVGLPSGRSALVLLPSGGGKSTLALEVLRRDGFTLLSDDSPLVDRLGRVYPYPMRLAFRLNTKLPEDWVNSATVFERRKHGPKLLIPISALPPTKIPRPKDCFQPGFLILGSRHGAKAEPEIKPLSSWRTIFPLTRDLVVGLGIPQVAELILTKGFRSLPGLAPTAASRLAAASAYAMRAQSIQLQLSISPEKNASILCDYLLEKDRR